MQKMIKKKKIKLKNNEVFEKTLKNVRNNKTGGNYLVKNQIIIQQNFFQITYLQ